MFNELIESIDVEISEIKKSRKKKYINVEYYKKISEFKKDYMIYEIYVSEYVSKMAEDLVIELTSVKHKLDATIVSVDENQMIKIKVKEPLTEEIYRINMEFDPSFLLSALSDCIEKTEAEKNPIVKSLLKRIPVNRSIKVESDNIEYEDLNRSQVKAIKYAESKQISFIWGPPGTGKTYTLSKIISRAYQRDEKVLVLSTSNVALDQILINLDKDLYDDEKDDIIRLGNTNNKVAYSYTSEAKSYKEKVKNVIFCTLANLSVKYGKLDQFDLVLIDEVSMVSLPYIFVAANKSRRNIVMIGDFRQLPPIALNASNDLFRMSIFDYLDIPGRVDRSEKVAYMAMLNTQYRMTKKISSLISDTFYNGLLKCGVKGRAKAPLNFINVDGSLYQNTYFSITDLSYFNPISLMLVEKILEETSVEKEILIVSPFRPQQNMLNALFRDKKEYKGRSLTVHKSQGSEADVVIFDLTTHAKTNKDNYHHFFIDEITKNLVNVAMSRAKEKLYVIGSLEMLTALAKQNILWAKLIAVINDSFTIIEANKLTSTVNVFDKNAIVTEKTENITVVDTEGDKEFYTMIKDHPVPNRNYLAREGCIPSSERKEITFRDLKKSDKLPYLVFVDDQIVLNEHGRYIYTKLEKTSKILRRIALESFIDTVEVDRVSTFTLNCERCGSNYMLQNRSGLTLLSCAKCRNTKHIGKNEAMLIKDLYQVKCPECNADVSPRKKKGHGNYSFYGCLNYPHCNGSVSMYSLAKGY